MSRFSNDPFANKFISGLMTPVSLIYELISNFHSKAYKYGIIRRHKLSVPVISIGNLTVGGTGKTPLTIDIAQRLTANGLKVAILSRGYKRLSNEQIVVVSNGKQIFADAKNAGDEPYMMAQSLPTAVVISGKKRFIAGQIAINLYGADVLLLDDGFQHLGLARDHNIVLLDYNCNLTKEKLLPAGRLRESVTALQRATWVVLTKVPLNADELILKQFQQIAHKYAPQAGFSSCRFIADKFLDASNHSLDLKYLHNKKVVAFCGLANPKDFYNQLKELGANLAETVSFPDHHWYKKNDIEALRDKLLKNKADVLVTTEKDFVRLDKTIDLPIVFLKISTQWIDSPHAH